VVKIARGPPPKAARSGLDGREQGARMNALGVVRSLFLPGHGFFAVDENYRFRARRDIPPGEELTVR
jgi:hypothetical protein